MRIQSSRAVLCVSSTSLANRDKGAKYTRSRLPAELVYHEAYEDRHEALSREWHIKRLPREEKLALIQGADTEKKEEGRP